MPERHHKKSRRLTTTIGITTEVVAERKRQDDKWGEQNHSPYKWMAILGEEYGEVCREAFELEGVNDGDHLNEVLERMRKEAIEVAAVAVAFVECIDRGQWDW